MEVSQISVCDMVAQSRLELDELHEYLEEGRIIHPFLPRDFNLEIARRWGYAGIRYRDRTTLDQLELTSVAGNDDARLVIEADGVISYSRRPADTAPPDEIGRLVDQSEQFLHDEVMPVMGAFLNYDLTAHERTGYRSDIVVLAFSPGATEQDAERFFRAVGERDYARLRDVWVADRHALIASTPSDDAISSISYSMVVRRFCARHLRLIRRYWKLNDDIVAELSDGRRVRPAVRRVAEIHDAVAQSTSSVERIRMSCARRLELLDRTAIGDSDLAAVIRDKLSDAEYEIGYVSQKLQLLRETMGTTRNRLSNHFKQASVRQMDWLQTIFLTSTIAALLALGAMPGSRLLTLDAEGNAVNEMVLRSFDFHSLVVFVPLAIGVTVIVRLITTFFSNRIVVRRVARASRRAAGSPREREL